MIFGQWTKFVVCTEIDGYKRQVQFGLPFRILIIQNLVGDLQHRITDFFCHFWSYKSSKYLPKKTVNEKWMNTDILLTRRHPDNMAI